MGKAVYIQDGQLFVHTRYYDKVESVIVVEKNKMEKLFVPFTYIPHCCSCRHWSEAFKYCDLYNAFQDPEDFCSSHELEVF